MSDYRVTVKVQNNNILSIIESKGYVSLLEFSKKTGFVYSTLCKLINMSQAPIDSSGKMRSTVYRLADILNCLPEELFSATQMETALETNKRTFEVEEAEMRFMLDSKSNTKSLEETVLETQRDKAISKALDTLTPRERKIIEHRFGLCEDGSEKTLRETAVHFDITSARVRQIEVKALRKLRHPSRGKELAEFA